MAALTPRGKALRHMTRHRGITEEPAGSNTDRRPHKGDARWGIRKAQTTLVGGATWLVGTPWCGTWCAWALRKAGVQGVSYRLASVALIEQDARAGRAPFRDWLDRSEYRQVLRGDLAVLFGRGVHVAMVRSFKKIGGQVYVITDEGNTSSGTGGSQSNGGGSYRRVRPLSDVHGFARVDFPGGWVRPQRLMMALESDPDPAEPLGSVTSAEASDRLLLKAVAGDPEAGPLADKLEEVLF